jgi:hypothetical protein
LVQSHDTAEAGSVVAVEEADAVADLKVITGGRSRSGARPDGFVKNLGNGVVRRGAQVKCGVGDAGPARVLFGVVDCQIAIAHGDDLACMHGGVVIAQEVDSHAKMQMTPDIENALRLAAQFASCDLDAVQVQAASLR